MGMKPQSKRKDFHEKGFPPNLEVFGELLLASSIAVDQWGGQQLEVMYHFGGRHTAVCRIKDLTGVVNASAIQGLVLRKMKLRETKGREGPKEVFTMILRDETDTIAVSCWGGMACLYEEINEGDVLVVQNSEVKERTPWSLKNMNTSSNFEMHVSEEKGGTIEPVQNTRNDFPKDYLLCMPLKVHCDTLEQIQRMNANEVVNVCAVVAQVQDLQRFSRKDQSAGCSRSIFLSDGSLNRNGSQVMKMIFWDEDTFQAGRVVRGDVVFIESARLSVYREERGLTFGSSSILYVNPPIGIADSISNWWKMSKGNVIAPNNKPSQARGATLEPHEIKNFWPLGGFLGGCSSESMVYCNVIALISRIGINNATYQACGVCKKTFYDEFNRCSDEECTSTQSMCAWKASICLIDDKASVECALFGDIANSFFGMEAHQFEMLTTQEKEQFEIQHRWTRYRVCLKGRGHGKFKATALAIDPVNYQEAFLNIFPEKEELASHF